MNLKPALQENTKNSGKPLRKHGHTQVVGGPKCPQLFTQQALDKAGARLRMQCVAARPDKESQNMTQLNDGKSNRELQYVRQIDVSHLPDACFTSENTRIGKPRHPSDSRGNSSRNRHGCIGQHARQPKAPSPCTDGALGGKNNCTQIAHVQHHLFHRQGAAQHQRILFLQRRCKHRPRLGSASEEALGAERDPQFSKSSRQTFLCFF